MILSMPVLLVEEPSRVMDFRLPESTGARILHQIRALGRTDRRELQRSLSISQPSVARHVSALLSAGLIEEIPPLNDERVGRPRKLLVVDGRGHDCWGVHIGTRSTELIIADAGGRIRLRRTLPLVIQDHSPASALETVVDKLRSLAGTHSQPPSVGVAFSAFVAADGTVTSKEYGWDAVPALDILDGLFGGSVVLATGAVALAASDLARTPLEDSAEASTLYFYARDILAHAWVFNGRVHRPYSGRAPSFLRRGDSGGQHPLSLTVLIDTVRAQGHGVSQLSEITALAERDQKVRGLLLRRAQALADIIATAVDVIDPQAVVLAGDTFTQDRITARAIGEILRQDKRDLRIHLSRQRSAVVAATQMAVQPLWDDPLANP